MSRPNGYLLAPTEYDPHSIISEVARGFNLLYADVISDRRSPHVFCVARACAMAAVRQATSLSYPAIGRLFNRDHTTVMHHVAKVADDPELSKMVALVVDEMSHLSATDGAC